MIALLALAVLGAQEATLVCHPEQGTHALVAVAGGHLQAGLDELSFRPSPFLPERLACLRWMASLPADVRRVNTDDLVPLMNPGGLPAARLGGIARDALYDACESSPFCTLRTPFSWLGLHWFAGRFDKPKAIFGRRADLCTEPIHPRARTSREPPLLRDTEALLPWITPRDTLASEIRKLLAPDATVLASTMTVSTDELRSIEDALTDNPGARVILLFDLNAAIDDTRKLGRWADGARRLYLLPVFSRPDRARYYHVKGAVRLDDRRRLVIGSPNLKGYEHTRLVDVGLTGVSAELGPAFADVLLAEANASCRAPETLGCSLDVAFGTDRAGEVHRTALAHACEQTSAFTLSSRMPFLLESAKDDVLGRAVALVRAAKVRVDIVTHRFDRSPLTDALIAAKRRGVQIEVQVGSELAPETVPAALRDVVHIGALLDATQLHTKMLRADGRVLWGSGNFTRGGLSENDEIFFESESPQMLRLFERALGEARALRGSRSVAVGESGDADVWLKDGEETQIEGNHMLVQSDPLLRPRFYRASGALAACLHARGPRLFYTLADLLACAD